MGRFLKEFGPHVLHYQAKDLMIDRDGLYERGVFSMGMGWQIPRIPGLGEVDWGVVFSELYRRRLRGRLHHRARGPPLRGHRREGQAGLPHRPRRPAAVLQVSVPTATWAEVPAPRSPAELTPELLADLLARVTERDIAKTIDHSLLRPGARRRVRRGRLPAGGRVRRRLGLRAPGRRGPGAGDPRRHRRRRRDDDRLPARQPPHGDEGLRGAPRARRRRDRAGHGHPDRGPQVRPRRRRAGGHRGGRRGGPRGRRASSR